MENTAVGKMDQQKFVVSYEPLLFMYLLPTL